MPSEVGKLGALTHLLLHNNVPGLGTGVPLESGVIPTQLGNMGSLAVLELTNNGLTGFLPDFLEGGFHTQLDVGIGTAARPKRPSWWLEATSLAVTGASDCT